MEGFGEVCLFEDKGGGWLVGDLYGEEEEDGRGVGCDRVG